jgi:transposase-like protein
MTQKKKGRPSKFTKDRRERIVQAIQAGCTYEMAADYAGVTRSTLWNWLKKGEDPKEKTYCTFLDQVKKAEVEGAMVHLGTIAQASQKDWKASAWMLERRHGYSRDGIQRKEEPVVELPTNTLELLRDQAVDLKKSMMKAEASESWQAFAALQRQFLQVVTQIKQIEAEEGMMDEMDGLSDEQLVQEITAAIISLPPILRQRLESDIQGLGNVVHINSVKGDT